MFFQISPGPVIHKKPNKPVSLEKVKKEDKMEVLSLAPFTPIPKITFENVKVGTTENRMLLIRNTTNQDVTLSVKKPVPEELNLVLNWHEVTIEKGQEVILELVWSPISEESCRHTMVLSDGRRLSRDVPVTFKSVDSKGSQPKRKKLGSQQQQKKFKSSAITLPLVRKSISPQKKLSRKISPKHPNPTRYLQQFCTHTENKENFSPVDNNRPSSVTSFMSPTNNSFKLDHLKIEGRETYTVRAENRETFVLQELKPFIPSPDSSFCRDSLDNSTVSPNETSRTRRLVLDFEEKIRLADKSVSPGATLDFEKKLGLIDLTACSSGLNSLTNTPKFSPSVISTSIKNSSSSRSLHEHPQLSITRLFADKNDTFHLSPISNVNANSDIYLKDSRSNLSCDTYVKANLSTETYVKANLSSGTYVKDNSVGNLATLESSPLSSLSFQQKIRSPIFLQPMKFESLSPVDTQCVITSRNALSCIQEETCINESSQALRLAAKRRSSSFTAATDPCLNESSQSLRLGAKRRASSFSVPSPSKKPNIVTDNIRDWSKKGGAACRLSKKSTGLNLAQFIREKENAIQTRQPEKSEKTIKTLIVQNPFLYANIIDPFMSSQLYSDEEWFVQQEDRFTKLLNALLTPPEEFSAEAQEVDVTKIWQEVKNREVHEAPSKEEVSNKYHKKSGRLANLRAQAQTLFRSKELNDVLLKVSNSIESGKLSARQDKDFHLNLRLKSEVMSILLSYHPLWLRIGLETIYNEVIPLKSNSDISGLTNFMLERLFKDPYLLKKHKTAYSPKYSADLKKFFLKKFFILVYFLDQAKNRKLIPHDPCLFCKKSTDKESKQILIHFARETLSAVGDITKFLKCFGYVVTHVQTYIHEFDYAVKNLGVDLRDGVRLAKVMEIIQLRNDLTTKLRVPAISRLQKVHNMEIVFDSLIQSGYKILYDINAKDIVDGHREKTLSFLWQIIYKFEAPLMVKSATTIQTWYRSLPIVLKRRKLQRDYKRKQQAAEKIQNWYRRYVLAGKILYFSDMLARYLLHKKMVKSAIVIQSRYRSYICQKRYQLMYRTIVNIQAISKGWLVRNRYFERIRAAKTIQKYYRRFIARRNYLRLRETTLLVQRKYRAKIAMRKDKNFYDQLKKSTTRVQEVFRANRAMKRQREEFVQLKIVAIKIQSKYRMILERRRYLKLYHATVTVQKRYRALISARKQRSEFLKLKQTFVSIQRKFRAKLRMRAEREKYQRLRKAVITVQSQFRMKVIRRSYLVLKSSVIQVQRRFRALIAMRKERSRYLAIQQSVVCIQMRYRAILKMKVEREKYLMCRSAVIKIQSGYRMYSRRKRYLQLRISALVIQRRYRAQRTMKVKKYEYDQLRTAVITVQTRYRATLKMRVERENYLRLRSAVIKIQSCYRMYSNRKRYFELRKAVLVIQTRYRALTVMRVKKLEYEQIRNATALVQRRFRATLQMKSQRLKYLKLRLAAVKIQSFFRMYSTRKRYLKVREAVLTTQRRYRAQMDMRINKLAYEQLRNAIVSVQRRFRAKLTMQVEREMYLKIRFAAIKVQSYYRMYSTRKRYLELRNAVIITQTRYRAQRALKVEKLRYDQLKKATDLVQKRFRANLLSKKVRKEYLELKRVTTTIQQRWRANKLMRLKRQEYINVQKACVKIQVWYRSLSIMKIHRNRYRKLKVAVLVIEQRYLANQLMKIQNTKYLHLKASVICIQRKYRATKEMRKQRLDFQRTKTAVVAIQQRFRANKLMKREQLEYSKLKSAAISIQARFRGNLAMQHQRGVYLKQRAAAKKIQVWFRATIEMKKHHERYIALKIAVGIFEERYIAKKVMFKERRHYLDLRKAAVIVQRRYRSKLQTQRERQRFCQLRSTVIFVQRTFIANTLMKQHRKDYLELRAAAVVVQQRYRARQAMQRTRARFVCLRNAVLFVQRRFREIRLTKQATQRFSLLKKVTVKLQQRYRAKKLMVREWDNFLRLRKSVILIQQRFRANQAAIVQRKSYLELQRVVVVFQRRFRMNRRRRLAATKIQALWRGYKVRSTNNLPNIVAIVERRQANLLNPVSQTAKTLGQRCEIAMKCVVSNSSSLVKVIRALEELDLITRHCPNLCIMLSCTLPDVLYITIGVAARSPPEMQCCNVAAFILINFCKYERTMEKSWNADYVDIILNVMLHWCDKEAPLFCTFSTLLWLFAHKEDWKMTLKGLPNLAQRLHKIKSLVFRKQSMVAKSSKTGSAVSFFATNYSASVPTRVANWGLDYGRPNAFTNAVHAIQCLIKILDCDLP